MNQYNTKDKDFDVHIYVKRQGAYIKQIGCKVLVVFITTFNRERRYNYPSKKAMGPGSHNRKSEVLGIFRRCSEEKSEKGRSFQCFIPAKRRNIDAFDRKYHINIHRETTPVILLISGEPLLKRFVDETVNGEINGAEISF